MSVLIEIRQAAASKATGGNTESVAPAPPAPADKVDAPPVAKKAPPNRNKPASEGTPPYAKESLDGDGWKAVETKAKGMFAKAKK